jgi:Tfp pilus assembly protein PilE
VEPVRASERGEGGAITSIEAFVLGLMAAILLAIAIPSYVAMRDRSSDSTARAQLRQASDAAEAYRAEHGSYARMSSAALTRFDADLRPSSYRLQIVRADGYCIESAVRGRTWHLGAPAQAVGRGGCP